MNHLPAPTAIAVQIPVTSLSPGDWIYDHQAKTWRQVKSVVQFFGKVGIVTLTGVVPVADGYATIAFT